MSQSSVQVNMVTGTPSYNEASARFMSRKKNHLTGRNDDTHVAWGDFI